METLWKHIQGKFPPFWAKQVVRASDKQGPDVARGLILLYLAISLVVQIIIKVGDHVARV